MQQLLKIYLALILAFAPLLTFGQIIVGKINDKYNVTPCGQFSYEIPMSVVSGTGGMVPYLSIVTNSSSGTGLLGSKCDLSGISIISRAPRNLYRDGKADVIRFDTNDRFMMDGERLTLIAETSSYREYRTEHNIFAKIISYGDNANPTKFLVYTKEGITREFTNSINLGANTGNCLYWLETKVYDTKGNYYTISYGKDVAHHEFWPERIEYTGNKKTGLLPYASVRFNYDTHPMISHYVSGCNVRKSHLIKEISCLYGNHEVRRYLFNYEKKEGAYYVKEITEATATERKNPTILKWDNYSENSIQQNETIHAYKNTKATTVIGDYNGDGKQDILVRPQFSDRFDYKIFLSEGKTISEPYTNTFQFSDNAKYIHSVMSGDFNGDGNDDIIVERGNGTFWLIDLYLSHIDYDGSWNLRFEKTIVPSIYLKHTLHVTDINCDGASDIIVRGTLASTDYFMLISESSESDLSPLVRQSESCKLPGNDTWEDVSLLDIDGDGTVEILNMHSNNKGILYTINADGKLKPENTLNFDTSYYSFGDFNGDGKTDIITMGSIKNPSTNWVINFSTGLKTKGLISFVSEQTSIILNSKDKRILVADINGDGYDDFYVIDNKTPKNGMASADIYINDRTGKAFNYFKGKQTQGTDMLNFGIAEFSGDGKTDIYSLPNSKVSSVDINIFLSRHNATEQLTDIIDGLGNITTISYARLTDGKVYTKNNKAIYPIVSTCTPWTVVSEVKKSDGIGGLNTTSYNYWNLLLHKRGGGALGFEKIITTDHATGRTRVDDYKVIKAEPMMMLCESRTFLDFSILSDEIYENAIDYQYKNGQTEASFFCYPKTAISRSYELTTGYVVKDMTTLYEYDNLGNCTKTIVESNGNKTITENEYDNDKKRWILGRLVKSMVTRVGADSSQSLTSCYKYDTESGLLIEESLEPDDANGYRKNYTYDSFGNIVYSVITPNNNRYESRKTETRYNSNGRFKIETENSLSFTTMTTVDQALGIENSSKDINGLVTKYEHNSFGELQKIITPLEVATKSTEWSSSNEHAPNNAVYLVRTKKTGKPETIVFYDGLGRELRKVVNSKDGRTIYVDQRYNSNGLVNTKSEPYYKGDEPWWTRYEYDSACRLVKERKPDGSEMSISYDGLTTVNTDANGNVSSKTYDIDGNLVKSTDAMNGSVVYSYDTAGKCVRIAGPRTTISMEYDRFGNMTKLFDPDMGTMEYKYSPYGEVEECTDSKGTTRYEYDQLGRLTCERRPDQSYTYIYDKNWNGALTMASTSDGIRKDYTYDDFGRIVSETEKIYDDIFTTKMTYNSQNKVETIEYPSGLVVKNNYTADGFLQTVCSADDNTTYWKADCYNASGNMLKESLGNGTTIETLYDACNRITSIKATNGFSWAFVYDKKGNLTGRIDNKHGLSETFTYDNLDRLVEMTDNAGHNQKQKYDASGNITYKSGVGNIIYQDNTNRIKEVKGTSCFLPQIDEVNYTSFNKVRYARRYLSENPLRYESLVISYGVDKEKKLESISQFMGGCGQNTDHHYAKVKEKYYVGNLYEEERTTDYSKSRCYIYAAGKLVAISENDGKDTRIVYTHHDNISSIIALSNEQGEISEEMSYDAWGRRRNAETWEYYHFSSDSLSTQEVGFTGHEHIDHFDMIDMQGRMYDPILGRFFSPDPIVQMPEYTQSMNRYSYCMNNPLTLTDPTGYSWIGDTFSTVVGVAVALETGGLVSGIWGAAIGGALGGASSSLVNSLINGNNLWQTVKNTFNNGIWGGISGFTNYEIGNFHDTIIKIAAHSVSEGCVEAIRSGHFEHGFIVGLASSASGEWINSSYNLSVMERIAANAALGGLVSEIGGGKFASGAITAAYVMMFNELKHRLVLCHKQRIHRTAVLDQNVGLENIYINVHTAVVMTLQKGSKYNIEVCATSDCEQCYSGTLTGSFESTFEANGKSSVSPITQTKGFLFTPKNCNFSGNLLYKNVEISKLHKISINIHGGWIYNTGFGRLAVGIPTILGTVFSYGYNHKYILK